jgi:hypothetical protein
VLDTSQSTMPLIVSQVNLDVMSLDRDSDGNGFLVGGSVCAKAGHLLQLGGTASMPATTGNDAVALRADILGPTPPTIGQQLHLVWRSPCINGDTGISAEPFGSSDVIVMATFVGTCPLMGNSIVVPPGQQYAFVGRVSRDTNALVWATPIYAATPVSKPNLAVRGDRFVFVAGALDALTIGSTLHASVDIDPTQSNPVGLVAELSPAGVVRWSSPLAGASTTSTLLLLSRGETLIGANGIAGAVIIGPLDTKPAVQADQSGGRLEPVVGVLTPYDFVARDVQRTP